jgi:hypothetical protein
VRVEETPKDEDPADRLMLAFDRADAKQDGPRR